MLHACKKIKVDHQAKFQDKNKMFPAAFISDLHFHWCYVFPTFNTHLESTFVYSADTYILVMA